MKKGYDFSKLKAVKNPYASKKKAVGINLSPEVVDYFKQLATETGLPYQKLIDLDCGVECGGLAAALEAYNSSLTPRRLPKSSQARTRS